MKIALIGYGKMGRTIEQLALAAGHEITLIIDKDNLEDLNPRRLREADVAIEFSQPESAYANICSCLEAGIPIVCGTTGWLEHFETVKALCSAKDGAVFYASNYSIGVNLFFALNRFLAGLMDSQPQYEVILDETHHTQKLDAPSGTAITLAEGILGALSRKTKWVNQSGSHPDELEIRSHRIGQVPGTHEIRYDSPVDTITIRHEAHSREGFASGAIRAAEWIIGRKGCFGMTDMLGI